MREHKIVLERLHLIKSDFENAKHRIIISIPDGQLTDEAKPILDMIKLAEKRGVDIICKSLH